MNQLKENLIWIALGIPGMVLIGLVLHSLVHFETGVLVITSMILGTIARGDGCQSSISSLLFRRPLRRKEKNGTK